MSPKSLPEAEEVATRRRDVNELLFYGPELPPAILSRSYGLRVIPYRWLWDSSHMHSSLVLVTPRGMAPALFSSATGGASTAATTPRLDINPVDKGMPVGGKQKKLLTGWSEVAASCRRNVGADVKRSTYPAGNRTP